MISVTSSSGTLKLKFTAEKIAKNSFINIGELLKKSVKKDMRKPKHGRKYVINGRSHTASASGESPAILTGELDKSVRYEMRGGDMIFGAGDSRINYAKFLELGTKKMEKRPFILSSVERERKNIEEIFKKTITKSIGS